ncbi:2-isopropylmalate synthase [Aspergillus eucalypticola CBS 122712]|uniref:2-isopropylmalate synthase n=1 Tax=Aspergillus eucalypticola (strain CBS 122712 / IBT 29274) TaxID=1448314 RepID=A0A317V9P8_ASPEC|nr:2-isopropylmalate synthase [Aspergillus eucalypticola CBS 122712]PWY68700.1 2-isopropylmalate synthase [Aspergillus eucalypticola CBS 122712]
MLPTPSDKYYASPRPYVYNRNWPTQTLTQAPRWLSTDLRDGNQALVQPMNGDDKLRYFQTLVKLGYKEIEVSYPSASQTEFNFTRHLISTPGTVPDDTWIQVMAPCREELIRRTIEAVRGARKVILHIHLSTSDLFREVVFKMTKGDIIDLAVRCVMKIRELTKESSDAEMHKTKWTIEFTLENFQDTSVEYAIEICEAVKLAWEPTTENKIIFNLPSTVEVTMPNVFADQIELFCRGISEREKVCVSVHPHNDRGCGVAAAEMAQLAGADRVEGCLFGNGERTGNVDLVTLALNLYTHGVSPRVNLSNLNEVVAMVEECTKIAVHPRAPYAGKYVFCTFTGTHQDAIRKGYNKLKESERLGATRASKWKMPYLSMDPVDLGRQHEAIVRVNSQSGKGGVAWLLKESLNIDMPRDLEIEFTQVVKAHANTSGSEVTRETICRLFRKHYMHVEPERFRLLNCRASQPKGNRDATYVQLKISVQGSDRELEATGGELLPTILDALRSVGYDYEVLDNQLQYIASQDTMTSFIRLATAGNIASWGVGMHKNTNWAVSQAILVAGQKIMASQLNDNLSN